MILLIYFLKHISLKTGLNIVIKEESVDLSDMPPPEGNEEVKERRGLKILTPNKLLTRFSILLADHTN